MAVRIENMAEPIPGYRLIERLGGGGFGEVWKAEAPGGIHKAIKFVFGDLRGAGDADHRAEQELKALRRVLTVRHPYILSLERFDIVDGQLMIVMELADQNLWDRFKECRAQGLPGVPRDELLRYMEEAAEALDLMNTAYDLQHLDIKPQNLFLVHQHIKVADFGLVKDMEGAQASVTGGVTPVYAAPETFEGYVTRFSDQYSLAIVYQELLTGQRPITGNNVRQLIMQHLAAPPNLSSLPLSDQPFVARALAKKPNERFPTCREFVLQLRAAAGRTGEEERLRSITPPSLLAGTVFTPRGSLYPDEGPFTPDSQQTAILGTRPDSAQGTQSLRPLDPVPVLSAVPGKAPAEVNGEGVLFPALVIGVGQLGLTVLQAIKDCAQQQFRGLSQVPSLRLLLLDTDPDVMRLATRGRPGAALSAPEVLLAPLNRPSYYLKPRDGRPGLNSWLNPRLLYRIPRSQVTTGVRALGRLAFCDHYRLVVRRLQAELKALLDPAVLPTAMRQTGLGMRSNRPRVYIVTSLAGGTGSGMFLDLAYTMRALLRQVGYEQPDVVSLLLLPPVDRNRTRVLALGNAYAALTELGYYGRPETIFEAQYHEREAPVVDSDPPFNRTVLLPLPEETDEIATRELISQAGRYLFRDLTSGLGRACDLGRAGLSAPPWQERGQFYQTFGLFELSWPRRALHQTAARKLCVRLVQRWLSKDSKPIREAVQDWVKDQWSGLALSGDNFLCRLREHIQQHLGRTPESVLGDVLAPLADKLAAAPSAGRKAPPPAEFSADELEAALTAFDRLLGRAGEEGPDILPELVRVLRASAFELAGEWDRKLAELPVTIIEEPGFRLAGAEEAVRNLIASIEQLLQHHESQARDLSLKASETLNKVLALAAMSRAGRRLPLTAPEILELLRTYSKLRYQSLIRQQIATAFVGLRGHLSDTLREINFCRTRLNELLRLFETDPDQQSNDGATAVATGKAVFPNGCKDLSEAVEQFLAGVSAEAMLNLDSQVGAVVKERFRALVHICTTTANILRDVETALLETAETFAAGLMDSHDVASMFLEQHPDPNAAEGEIASFFQEATPELRSNPESRAGELCLLAVPDGPAGDQFRAHAAAALPRTDLTFVPSSDDIVLVRELVNLPLESLEQLGPLGEEAYRQMNSAEHFTPHSRTDVKFR
jgi:serine/threonine protein kinase